MKPRRLTLEPTEPEIQHAAFLLWEEQGRPAGRDLEIWLAAKERLKHALPYQGWAIHRARNLVHQRRKARAATAGIR